MLFALHGAQLHAKKTTRITISSHNQNMITQGEYDKSGRRTAVRCSHDKYTTVYTALRDGTLWMMMTDPLRP